MDEIQLLFNRISGKHVFLIGDVYLNENLYGVIEKFSDDGPIPVVQKHHCVQLPGAAGYAALLLKQMGLNVTLFTILGDDSAGNDLLRIFAKRGIITDCVLTDSEYRTSNRTRIRVEGYRYTDRDILNIDSTEPMRLSEEKLELFAEYIESHLDECDGIVLLDKDKSIVTPALVDAIVRISKKKDIPLIGSSESQLELYKKFFIVVSNLRSVQSLLDGKRKNRDQPAKSLKSHLKCHAVYMSLGKEGVCVVSDHSQVQNLTGSPLVIQDLYGSDEAVLTAVTAGTLGNRAGKDIAELANIMSSVAASRSGYYEFDKNAVQSAIKRTALNNESKHVNIEQLKSIVLQARAVGKKVVWTNGCYDILHAGHVIYLEKAKQSGDILVVGLNSDASVQKIKGVLRPVMEENERAKVLSSLSFVDYVVIFDDNSPAGMISILRPDVYAKGGDYTIDTINQEERRLVESYGGEIALLPGVEGMSTTEMIRRILKAYGKPGDLEQVPE